MKNLYNKTVYGVGYIGNGSHKITVNAQRTDASNAWKNMIQRCYKGLESHPSYNKVFVCEQWHNFQNFAKWHEENYIEGWQLDKDILVKGNKIYCPQTCAFVPPEINYLFVKCNKKRGEYPIGVSLVHNRFQATLRKNGKTFNLGRFNTPEEAFESYKGAKEKYIKDIANKWKNEVTEEVYQALVNYIVEITD
jgi:hypothetical protein